MRRWYVVFWKFKFQGSAQAIKTWDYFLDWIVSNRQLLIIGTCIRCKSLIVVAKGDRRIIVAVSLVRIMNCYSLAIISIKRKVVLIACRLEVWLRRFWEIRVHSVYQLRAIQIFNSSFHSLRLDNAFIFFKLKVDILSSNEIILSLIILGNISPAPSDSVDFLRAIARDMRRNHTLTVFLREVL